MNKYDHVLNYVYNISSNMKSAMYYRGYLNGRFEKEITEEDF